MSDIVHIEPVSHWQNGWFVRQIIPHGEIVAERTLCRSGALVFYPQPHEVWVFPIQAAAEGAAAAVVAERGGTALALPVTPEMVIAGVHS